MNRMVKVSDMLKYAQDNNLKLLSDFSAVFWVKYIQKSAEYDKIFARLYKSFYYFDQTDFDTIEDVTTAFIDAVKGHLLLNEKKYDELYRVNVVDDEEYNLLNNYYLTEKMDRDTSNDKGIRTDTVNNTFGQQVVTTENDVTTYDSDVFNPNGKNTDTIGNRVDTGSFISGSQLDTATEDYTLTREGNIGTISGADMIKKHIGVWSDYEFMAYIFSDISRELLALG